VTLKVRSGNLGLFKVVDETGEEYSIKSKNVLIGILQLSEIKSR
jgi:hypothetical protein